MLVLIKLFKSSLLIRISISVRSPSTRRERLLSIIIRLRKNFKGLNLGKKAEEGPEIRVEARVGADQAVGKRAGPQARERRADHRVTIKKADPPVIGEKANLRVITKKVDHHHQAIKEKADLDHQAIEERADLDLQAIKEASLRATERKVRPAADPKGQTKIQESSLILKKVAGVCISNKI
jgi:hypothetical protein